MRITSANPRYVEVHEITTDEQEFPWYRRDEHGNWTRLKFGEWEHVEDPKEIETLFQALRASIEGLAPDTGGPARIRKGE